MMLSALYNRGSVTLRCEATMSPSLEGGRPIILRGSLAIARSHLRMTALGRSAGK